MQSSNEKLKEALLECMQKDLAFVPSNKEIKKQYVPSESFNKKMKAMIRREKTKEKFKLIYENKRKIYYFAGGVAILILSIKIGTNFMLSDLAQYDTTEQIRQSDTISMMEDSDTTESMPKDFASGQTLPEQSIQEAQNSMNLLWTIEALEENQAVFHLKNDSEEAYSYTDISQIDQYENNTWVTVYSNEEMQNHTLAANEEIEEIINLTDYHIEKSGTYRLYRNINKKIVTVDIEIP